MVQLLITAIEQTPPSYPIYGVHFSDEEVQSVVSSAFPNSNLISAQQLSRGRSYNNRIYFLKVRLDEDSGNDPQSRPRELELVLKVNGRFFGADKVQNEVSSLWLLEKYCPEIPAPRIFAWSEDGGFVITLSEDRNTARSTKLEALAQSETKNPAWILMSRVTGESLSNLDLEESEWAKIGTQVASLADEWRRSIPTQSRCGGICFKNEKTSGASLVPGPDPDRSLLDITGIVGDGLHFSSPVTNAVEFHRVKLEDKLRQLETSTTYARNKPSLSPLIRKFISTTLSKLDLVTASEGNGNDGFVFTHYDLSPRNILVTKGESGYAITGIVDFEFAGFFPALEEFVNDYVDNGGDWPKASYEAYLHRLEALGVPTPAKGIEKQIWEQAHWLGQLLENIAPWWLPGDLDYEKLEQALDKSKGVVLDMLESFERATGAKE